MPQPQHLLEGLYREYVQLERKADIFGDAQGGAKLDAEGGVSQAACHCLDSDRQKLLEVLGGTSQLLIGRNSIGKTQLGNAARTGAVQALHITCIAGQLSKSVQVSY